MGYYADGSGSITFKKQLANQIINKVEEILGEVFETFRETDSNNKTVIGFYADYKYDEDAVIHALNSVAQISEIDDGEIDYSGAGDLFWRFIYRDGKWILESGYIAYESHLQEVARILAELFNDECACNFDDIDEWLPNYCEYRDKCPNPGGAKCWEQYLKHREKTHNPSI